MQKSRYTSLLALTILFMLSGCCSQYARWGRETFNQGTELDEYTCIPRKYLRAERVYDQFNTLGIFDALWLSQDVIESYVDSYALKRCFTPERKEIFLQDQLAQTDDYISFYVSTVYHGIDKMGLDKDHALWKLLLSINDGPCIKPVEIKKVDELDNEYRAFFGIRMTVFRTVYLVRFPAVDGYGNKFYPTGPATMIMYLRRIGHQGCMCWQIEADGTVLPYPYFDKDELAYDIDCTLY